MKTRVPRFDYAATLFQPGGTVAPPAGEPAPQYPPAELVPDSWERVAGLSNYGNCPTSSRVPAGFVRVIFAQSRNLGAAQVAFDIPAADYRPFRNREGERQTLGDYRGVSLTPARPDFYY